MDDDTGPAMTLAEVRELHPPPWRIEPIPSEGTLLCTKGKYGHGGWRFPAGSPADAHAGIVKREALR